MNSPLTYMGGKYFARKILLARMPVHDRYAEPFAGSASLFFAKPLAKHSTLNDIDPSVINVYKCLRDDWEVLASRIPDSADRDTFNDLKGKEFTDPLHDAVRYLYLNRSCYGAKMKTPVWSSNNNTGLRLTFNSLKRRFPDFSYKLSGCDLTSLDFEESIDSLEDNTFVYIDPPYLGKKFEQYYRYGEVDHSRIASVLCENSNRLKFLVSYNDCDEVAGMYNGWNMEQVSWSYNIDRSGRKMNELLLSNYAYVRQQSLF